MIKDKVYSNIETHLEDLLATLGEVVQIETPSHEDKAASDVCCDYLEKLYDGIGFRMERIPQSTCGDDLYGEIGSGEKLALIVGHYDTVFPLGTLKTMPWKRDENKAYGPGALDMKGGLIMAYYGIKALQETNGMPDGIIGIYIDSNEESGSFCSSDRIVEKAREYRAVIVMEPGYKELGTFKSMRYGRGTYTVTAHGRAAHSGTNPKAALSPFLEIANQLYRMDKWLNEQEDASFAPTVIKGGIEGTCVVPETASFIMDVRFRTQEAMDRVHKELMELDPVDPRYTITVDGGIDKPIMIASQDLIEKIAEIAPDYDIELDGRPCSGGSDGNFTGGAGIPIIDGLGMSGEFLHNPNEYINIDHIVPRTALFARLLQKI